jgi:hypothetical protein
MTQVNIKVEARGVALARPSRPRLKRRKDVSARAAVGYAGRLGGLD